MSTSISLQKSVFVQPRTSLGNYPKRVPSKAHRCGQVSVRTASSYASVPVVHLPTSRCWARAPSTFSRAVAEHFRQAFRRPSHPDRIQNAARLRAVECVRCDHCAHFLPLINVLDLSNYAPEAFRQLEDSSAPSWKLLHMDHETENFELVTLDFLAIGSTVG